MVKKQKSCASLSSKASSFKRNQTSQFMNFSFLENEGKSLLDDVENYLIVAKALGHIMSGTNWKFKIF